MRKDQCLPIIVINIYRYFKVGGDLTAAKENVLALCRRTLKPGELTSSRLLRANRSRASGFPPTHKNLRA